MSSEPMLSTLEIDSTPDITRCPLHGIDGSALPEVVPPSEHILKTVGEARLRALVFHHHALLLKSPIAYLFTQEDEHFWTVVTKIADFFVEACGGKNYYSGVYGRPQLRRRHIPFMIDEAGREIWLTLYKQALRDVDFPSSVLEAYWTWIEALSIRLVNQRNNNIPIKRVSFESIKSFFVSPYAVQQTDLSQELQLLPTETTFESITTTDVLSQQERTTLSIFGEVKKPSTLHLIDLFDLPTASILVPPVICAMTYKQLDTEHLYKGVLLKNLLNLAIIKSDKPLYRTPLYIVVTAYDGYQSIFSWHEVFNAIAGDSILLAYSKNNRLLEDKAGSMCLLTTSDIYIAPRLVKGVKSIEVRRIYD
ncbi:molybdopterin-dependent oxidoreductase [Beggiatoa leptomitoformis]|uniref:Molybdopterin-dependent oxidoreductase n=1 Tax=Beggiatoa leptomitoformis TaxID=288004 RepID=A0A2N9YFM6_9GAMM|nr:molybdopterin-dependent oxidoreductase [Beggiatoa leptomitoformis]AUI69294.1 molybdopterin-dependent oxidoreductase [Beggiatoa leptomitoformis]QGX03732.1 molybdopterin-dependent oxidoreductase [Beggiatoa leptomitoformis]